MNIESLEENFFIELGRAYIIGSFQKTKKAGDVQSAKQKQPKSWLNHGEDG